MISVKDTSILAMLSRYPTMPAEEADRHIAQIEHEENIPLCHAVLGRIPPEELESDTRQTYYEFMRWSEDRTRRFRAERMVRRQTEQIDPVAARLLSLRRQGLIPEETLMLYGISGDLPDRDAYAAMATEERRALWQNRMQQAFGRNWQREFTNLPAIFTKEREIHNWIKEGF